MTTILDLFLEQQLHRKQYANTTVHQRYALLATLKRTIEKYQTEVQEALWQDFRKHPAEVDLTEIYPVMGEIKHAMANIGEWTSPQRVTTPLGLLGTSSHIQYEAKGVCLLISPWNFPFNLTFGPLVGAIAAGCSVIVKPSEVTPATAMVMEKIISEVFPPAQVVAVLGDVSVATELLRLPFNHIFFTGAPSIGKVVMRAAAEHLTSVTLELGGKCPTIIDETCHLRTAARRVAWAKFLNNGQICIAPDYVLVHRSRQAEFTALLQEYITLFFGQNPSEKESGYNRIVSPRHWQRLQNYLQDAQAKGATIVAGNETHEADRYLSPTLVTDVPADSLLMKEEIFGPILPILPYDTIAEVADHIRKGDKPLGLYIYSRSEKNIRFILQNTQSGGVAINHSAIQFFNHYLPFGGSNVSGIGKAHGHYGFLAFSNEKAVLRQWLPFSTVELMMPPYNRFKRWLIQFSIKWL